MKLRSKLTCAGVVTLMLTSLPLILLVLPSRYFQAHASGLSNAEPSCRFPEFLQTKKDKNWMVNLAGTITTFDVEGGRIYARYGGCRSGDISYHRRRQSGFADCTQSNYTRVCLAKKGDNRYLLRHIESTFGDKFICMEFLKRGVSVVQIKMSMIKDEQHVQRLCDPVENSVDPWPWISEEHYRSQAVDCPFSAGFNLRLEHFSPTRASRYANDFYGYSSSYSTSDENSPHACADSTTAPIRIESDCVSREGIVFHFKHESCLPSGSRLALRQRALCMSTWSQDGEDFAMLRADNNDRNFFCLRVSYDNNSTNDVKQVALFDGWVCPTSNSVSTARHPKDDSYSRTPHMIFSVKNKHVVTEPCSDELSICHSHTRFCRVLHCMRTCGKCFPSRDSSGASRDTSTKNADASSSNIQKKATLDTNSRFALQPSHASVIDDSQSPSSAIFGVVSDDFYGDHRDDVNGDNSGDVKIEDRKDNYDGFNANSNSVEEKVEPTDRGDYRRPCTFPEDMRGAWLQRTVDGTDERILITDSTLHHPTLGDLECITFSLPSDEEVPLRRVLWGHYDNGCYPRFTCMHYNTPAKSVMRYRLADMQQWPLQLSDDAICDEKHFLEPPDMYQPGDKYSVRSWEVVRREGPIYRMACVLPHNFPRVVSFLDDRGRSGCFVHGTYYSPRAISLSFFPEEDRKAGNSLPGKNDNLGRDGTHMSSNRKEEGGGNTEGNSGGSFTGYNEPVTNAFRGSAVWNGTGSDGTYYAVDPYADAHYGSNERLSQGSSSHGRYLKRSHDRASVKNNIVGTKASVNDVKTRHSRKHKTKDGTVPDDYTANSGTDARQRRRRDTNLKTFHKDTVSPRKYHKTKDDHRLQHHHGSKRDNKFKHHQKSKVVAVEKYSSSKTHDSGALPKENVHVIANQNVSRNDKDTNLLRISALLYNKNDVRGLSRASSLLHNNDNARDKSDHKSNTHKQQNRRRRQTNHKSRSNPDQHSYECLAVMTYVDSYKSLLTVTVDNPHEILCWLVVDEYTVVILKTSSCNSQTAQLVLKDHGRLSKHGQHAHLILHLHQGEKDCDTMFPADEIWPEPVQILNQESSNAGASYHMRTACLWWNVLYLWVLLVTIALAR